MGQEAFFAFGCLFPRVLWLMSWYLNVLASFPIAPTLVFAAAVNISNAAVLLLGCRLLQVSSNERVIVLH